MENQDLKRSLKLFCQAVITRVALPALPLIAEEPVTQVQLACLRFVRLHLEPSVGAIADGLAISNAAAAKLIDRLVKKDLLTREEDQKDRRVLKINLTSEGEKLLAQANKVEDRFLEAIVNKMSPEDLQSLETGLAAFLRASLNSAEEIEQICLKCGLEHVLDCFGNQRYQELTGKNRTEI